MDSVGAQSSTSGARAVPEGQLPGPVSAPAQRKRAIPRSATAGTIGPRRTPRACVSCREKKSKCDGVRPKCKLCAQTSTVCSYVRSKRETQQWQLQSLRRRIDTYEDLLREILSHSNAEDRRSIEDVVERRFPEAPDAFATLLTTGSLPDQHVSMPYPGLSLRRMQMALASQRDATKIQLLRKDPTVRESQIQAWTSLVDNEVASHLFSLYFTWENPTWHLIDLDVFVHDLERGRTRFCSSLLVHLLLFFGCSFSYNLTRITNRRDEKSLGEKLYAEIQRLWLLERDIVALPTAQSGIMIGLLCCTFGIDRLGTRYIMHGAELARRLDLHEESSTYFQVQPGDDSIAIEKAHKMLAWAIFDVQALASQVYRKTPAWPQPPLVRLLQVEAMVLDEGREWCPYPFRTPTHIPFFYTAAWIRNELVAVVNEIASFALTFPDAARRDDVWDYGYVLYYRLVHWRAHLPWTVMPRHNTTPHVLCLHFYYQATLVSLCGIYLTNFDAVPQDARWDPLAVKDQAMNTIGSLVLLYRHSHGWKSVPIVMLHYFCLAGVDAISKLHPREPKWALVLESCVVGLWHLSLGWGRLCTAFLRTIELVMKATKPDPSLVPPKVSAIFQQLSSSRWSAKDVSSLAADYMVHHIPNGVGTSASANAGPRAQTLESLILSLEGLSMQ
ncbi:putative C6 transcription factor [Aspergillus steynii IBT 23096]|uniref:Putative C6 transcription factor n=1 Tax=Aspergillus steynii IBT 23096 TaxID=1392250 RepID=A0A2I2G6U1_9EURO|nr:putative C6 transcription factor [Aspergillus steynii IBT 23096]PLB48594.1 putative C6 transcription factor [Aspergillus steynii IBT 23096]